MPDDSRGSRLGLADTVPVTEAATETVPTVSDLPARWEVRGELGRGGMGRVLLAHDEELGRDVAVKLLQPGLMDVEHAARFLDEARIAAQLHHPSIVTLHDVGITDSGQPYCVMELLEGTSLRRVLDDLAIEDAETVAHFSRHRLLAAFEQVCRAVAYAHTRGVLHRDLKPENLVFGRFGEVRVVDWGLATAPHPDLRVSGEVSVTGDLTGTAHGAGTPGYMAPEVVTGDADPGVASEVWALGAVLYEILTLRPAVGRASLAEMLQLTIEGGWRTPREVAPERRIDEELEEITLQALALDPSARHADCEALADAVEGFLDGSRRRAAARAHLTEAEIAWARYREASSGEAAASARERDLAASMPAGTPLEEKAELVALRGELDRLGLQAADRFADAVGACEQALSQDPGNEEAREALAGIYRARAREEDRRGNRAGTRFYERRAAAYEEGLLQGALEEAALTLTSAPPATSVVCREVIREGLVWQLGEPRELGPTPLIGVPLAPGSWVLELRTDDGVCVTVPLRAAPGELVAPSERIGLRAAPEGWVYVPGGPFRRGGDDRATGSGAGEDFDVPGFLIARHPVTVGEYLAFLDALAATDPDEAWARAPRLAAADGEGVQYVKRPDPGEPYEPPGLDRDGDPWLPEWPVIGVSWHDAVAYAAWRTEVTGVRHRLPREWEWEKAARGVDGRLFPWGDRFDPALANVGNSRAKRALPAPVGSAPHDRSVYGVEDLAGGVTEWCAERREVRGRELASMRGGNWLSDESRARLAGRKWMGLDVTMTSSGIRLARDLP